MHLYASRLYVPAKSVSLVTEASSLDTLASKACLKSDPFTQKIGHPLVWLAPLPCCTVDVTTRMRDRTAQRHSADVKAAGWLLGRHWGWLQFFFGLGQQGGRALIRLGLGFPDQQFQYRQQVVERAGLP